MDCPEEFRLIDQGLRGAPGVIDVRADYLHRVVRVRLDPASTNSQEVRERLAVTGFPPATPAHQVHLLSANWRWVCVVVGLVLLAAAAALYVAGAAVAWYAATATCAAVVAAMPVVAAAGRAMRLGRIDMNVLMVIAATGALCIGEWFEAATAMTLFGVANWLERASLRRAGQAIESLAQLLPQVAHLVSPANGDGQTTELPVSAVQVGDTLLVRPGEHIPVDGVVAQGASAVIEAAVTGESLPTTKAVGDPVFGGSVNGESALHIVATATADDSAVSQVGRLVEQARSRRSGAERFVDRFARYYTPVVIGIACLVAFGVPLLLTLTGGQLWTEVFGEWLHRGLVLLVIACPCALVISTPITMVCGLQRATRAGMLIKGGDCLEVAASVDTVAVDKTGTLTVGHPEVVAVRASAGDQQRLLQLAASLEAHSHHPLARAIIGEAQRRQLPLLPAEQVVASLGQGITGTVDGTVVRVGTTDFVTESLPEKGRTKAQATEPLAEDGQIAVFISAGDEFLGALQLADRLREDAQQGLGLLPQIGVRRIVMLTGDRWATARQVAAQLGIADVHARLLPAEKIEHIQRLRAEGARLAMVGDGFNDAPALAAADLGVAMGGDASSMALESADVVVLSPQLRSLPRLFHLAQQTRDRLWQNIGLALLIKAVILLVTAIGYGSMWLAVAADVGASLVVVFNGMRLLNVNLEVPPPAADG